MCAEKAPHFHFALQSTHEGAGTDRMWHLLAFQGYCGGGWHPKGTIRGGAGRLPLVVTSEGEAGACRPATAECRVAPRRALSGRLVESPGNTWGERVHSDPTVTLVGALHMKQ